MAEHNVTVRIDDVAVRHEEDNCYISGMTFISEGRLLVNDFVGASIKLVDTRMNKIVALLFLQEAVELRDIARMSSSTAVVAISDKKVLQVVSVSEHSMYTSISFAESIKVDGYCSGVDYNENKDNFVVSYKETCPKIEILSRTGSCLARWNLEIIDGRTPRPLYVCFGNNGNNVIVSDNGCNTVLMFSETDGTWTQAFTHSSEYLKNPRGIIVLNDNSILVSCRYTNQVLMFSNTGQFLRTVVSGENGLVSPCALAFSFKEQTLYVSAKTFELPAKHWGNLKVFKVHF